MITQLIATYGPFWGLLIPCVALIATAGIALVIVTERHH